MALHGHCVAFAVVLTMIIIASQPTEAAAKLKVKKEKVSNLQFYLHETLSGERATAVTVARASSTKNSSSFTGSVSVFDDPMTEGPDPTSKLLGRVQGLSSVSSQIQGVGQVIAVTFVFQSGEFKGSTLAVVTHQEAVEFIEMPIVGGTGKFRLARGYALVQVLPTNAVEHYNVTVLHY